MISRPLVSYVLMAALRDRLILSLVLLVALGASLALFVGSSAVVEKGQFAMVFAAGGLRFAGAGGLVLFVTFYIRRAFETREVEFLLAKPLSRPAFILSHAVAFSLLAIALAAAITLAIAALMPPQMEFQAIALWGASLAAEFIIVANAAFFFAMVIGSAAGSAMAVSGLYILARLMGQILGVLDAPYNLPFYDVLSAAMKTVSVIVPRLDLMAQTSWLLYGSGGGIGWGFIAGHAAIYTGLLIAAAMADLARRQF